MKFFLYILYSLAALRTYVGQTNNISNRLSLHNSGKVRSTKAFSPWILIFSDKKVYSNRGIFLRNLQNLSKTAFD